MKGMLLKDILNIRGQIAYYAVIIAVFFAVAAVTGNLYFYAGISCFCGVAVPLSAVARDARQAGAFTLSLGAGELFPRMGAFLSPLCAAFVPHGGKLACRADVWRYGASGHERRASSRV